MVRPATACSVPGSAASAEVTAAFWRELNGAGPVPAAASVTCAWPSPVSGRVVKVVTDELKAGRQHDRRDAGADDGGGQDRATGTGERHGEPERHRTRSRKARERALGAMAGPGRRGLPGDDGRDRAQPAGPDRGDEAGQHDDRDHGCWGGEGHPQWDGDGKLEEALAGIDHREHPLMAEKDAGGAAGHRGRDDLQQVCGHDLDWGEPDALQHPDPAVAGHDYPADHGGGDQCGQHDGQEGEGEDERGVDALHAAELVRGQQPGDRADDSALRQRRLDRLEIGVHLDSGGSAAEGVEHLLLGRRARRYQRGDSARGHPRGLLARGGAAVSHDEQAGPARQPVHGHRRADREAPQVGVVVRGGDLVRRRRPPPAAAGQVVKRPAERRAAGDGQGLRRGRAGARLRAGAPRTLCRCRPSDRHGRRRVRSGGIGHLGEAGRVLQLLDGRSLRVDVDSQIRAVVLGELLAEPFAGAGVEGKTERRRRARRQQDDEQHGGLDPPARDAAGRSAQHRLAPHRRAVAMSLATWPSSRLTTRREYLAASSGLWVTITSVCPAVFSSSSS